MSGRPVFWPVRRWHPSCRRADRPVRRTSDGNRGSVAQKDASGNSWFSDTGRIHRPADRSDVVHRRETGFDFFMDAPEMSILLTVLLPVCLVDIFFPIMKGKLCVN